MTGGAAALRAVCRRLTLVALCLMAAPGLRAEAVADPPRGAAVQALSACLADPGLDGPAIFAQLRNVQLSAAEALPIDLQLLRRSEIGVRLFALDQLAGYGRAAEPASSAVMALVSATEAMVRGQALITLQAIAQKPLVEPQLMLKAATEHGLGTHARAAALVLLGREPVLASVLAEVTPLAEDADDEVALAAYRLWSAAAPGGPEPAPAVAGLPLPFPLQLPMPQQGRLLDAIARDGPGDEPTRTALLQLATHGPGRGAALRALEVLAHVGMMDARVDALMLALVAQGRPFRASLARTAISGDAGRGWPGAGAGSGVAEVYAEALRTAGPTADGDRLRVLAIRTLDRLQPDAVATAALLQDFAAISASSANSASASSPADPQPGTRSAQHAARPRPSYARLVALLRAISPERVPAAMPLLIAALDPRSALFRDCSHEDAEVIRALLLASWARCPADPPELQHVLLEVLAAPDPKAPLAFAAAARVVAAHHAPAWAVPYLAAALSESFTDVAVDCGDLSSIALPRMLHGPPHLPAPGPCARIEAIHALAALGPAASASASLLDRRAAGHPALPGPEQGEERIAPAVAEAYWQLVAREAASAANLVRTPQARSAPASAQP